jgi:TolB-like protein/DNA-binding SARP family transcriptional activator/Flp pilus assembly protein TadD
MRPDRRERRERLADLLWGDRGDAQARHSLRQCLVGLRRDLQASGLDVLAIEGEDIAIDCGLVSIDALDLIEAVDAGDLERATGLYRGEFLAGLTLDCEPFDEWARSERDRFVSLGMHALAAAAAAADTAGDGARATAMIERLVAIDPLREDSQRILLRIYARYRGRDAALAHAKTLAATLQSELDVEPEADTAQLIDDIRQGMIPLAAPASQQQSTTPDDPPVARDMAVATPVSERAGESDFWPRRWRPLPLIAGAATAVATAVVMVMLPWGVPEQAGRPRSSDAQAASNASNKAGSVDQSWRSPGIYRSAGVDDAALASAHRQALVVLPFAVDDPTDAAAQTLARRITADLISDLSRTPTIRVISGRTSQLYGGRPVDVAAVGAELGVHYVVEGSVRKAASRIYVNVALTDAKTRLQSWSARFDRDLSERFSVQDEIVKGIARVLHVAVIIEEGRQRRGDAHPVGRPLAKGWAAIFRANENGGPGEAKAYFEEALRIHPEHPSALTGLAAHHILSLVFEVVGDRRAIIGRAEELLTRALQQQPRSSSAHYFLGLARKVSGDPEAALKSFAKAIELNPSHAAAYANAGHMLVRLGRPDEGLDHIRYAIRLSPKDPALASWQVFGGEAEITRGNEDAAIEWLTHAITLSPRRLFARALLGAAYMLKGDSGAAAQQVAEWRKLAPGITNESLISTLGGLKKLSPRVVRGLRQALGYSS